MDIMDDFPKEEKIMESEKVEELMDLIRLLMKGVLSADEYFQKLADFWNKHEFPEYAEETLLHIKA